MRLRVFRRSENGQLETDHHSGRRCCHRSDGRRPLLAQRLGEQVGRDELDRRACREAEPDGEEPVEHLYERVRGRFGAQLRLSFDARRMIIEGCVHDIVEFLKDHDPFSGLDAPTLERLAERVEVEFFAVGTTIFRQADVPRTRCEQSPRRNRARRPRACARPPR